MIEKAIVNAFKSAKKRGWDKVYLALDLYGCVIKPDYVNIVSKDFYKGAIETHFK